MTFLPMVLVVLFVRTGQLGEPTANHGDHAYAKPHNSRPVWENSSGNRLSWRLRRKAALTPKSASGVGENRSETRLSWRSRFDWTALKPKPAARDRRFGKNLLEPVYHGGFPGKKRLSRQTRRLATDLGKFPAEPVYHGDRQEQPDLISEAVRIGEIIGIGETRGDDSCRRGDRRQEAQLRVSPFLAKPKP